MLFCHILTKVYSNLKRCLHKTRNEISFHQEKNFVYITFRYRLNEINFLLHLCFYEIFACADFSFRMISFRGSVYMIFIPKNQIHFGVFRVNRVSFYPK